MHKNNCRVCGYELARPPWGMTVKVRPGIYALVAVQSLDTRIAHR